MMTKLTLRHVKHLMAAADGLGKAHDAVVQETSNHASRHTAALDAKRKAAEIEARIADGISAINHKV